MTAQLTSQERINRAIEHRDHDRVPRFDQIWPETWQRWESEGMTTPPAERYDWDMVWLPGWFAAPPFAGEEQVLEEDEQTRVTRNAWGARLRTWKDKSGTPEHLGWECTDPEVWRKRFKPRFAPEHLSVDIESKKKALAAARDKGKWACTVGHQCFEAMRAMLGDETFLMAMAGEPDWIREISQTYTDALLWQYERMAEAGVQPDGVWNFEDLAYTQAPFCSPAMYRELVWPDHKRLADWVHDHDMKLIFHTDGDIRGHMDLFVEAGFDMLQPLEAKANVDIRELAPTYGREVAFFGNIDMTVAITNDRDKVEHEVRTKLEAGMAHKGYLYHSDHSVPPQVSWSTYQYMMKLVEQHGNY